MRLKINMWLERILSSVIGNLLALAIVIGALYYVSPASASAQGMDQIRVTMDADRKKELNTLYKFVMLGCATDMSNKMVVSGIPAKEVYTRKAQRQIAKFCNIRAYNIISSFSIWMKDQARGELKTGYLK